MYIKITKCNNPYEWFDKGFIFIVEEKYSRPNLYKVNVNNKTQKKIKKLIGYKINFYNKYLKGEDITDVTRSTKIKKILEQ